MITVGITTRNRPEALDRCLESLRRLNGLVDEVIVADDHSKPPVRGVRWPARPVTPEVIEVDNYIQGRNRIVARAGNQFVLLLDDDAVVLSAAAVHDACAVLTADAGAAAVAFAQAEPDGAAWPAQMQPARVSCPSVVASFIGFAHLLRRDVFLRLGGYRERLEFYGEEKDFCLRVLDAGLRVVYLPDARVAHVPDPSGRSQVRYVRHAIRNDCLTSLYSEPLPMFIGGLPVRLRRYRRMARGIEGGDPGGLRWILGEVARAVPDALRHRRPVAWSTVREWRRLTRDPRPYSVPGSPA